MDYEKTFLLALIFTVFAEFLAIFLLRFFSRFKFLKKIKLRKIFLASCFSSFLTLPYVWFVLPVFFESRILYVLISEVMAVFFEGVIYKNFLNISFKKALFLSAFVNLFSFAGGRLLKI